MEEVDPNIERLVISYKQRLQEIVYTSPRLRPIIQEFLRLGEEGIGLTDYELILHSEDDSPAEPTLEIKNNLDESVASLGELFGEQLAAIAEEDQECDRITDEMLYVYGIWAITIPEVALWFKDKPRGETAAPRGLNSFRDMMVSLGLPDPDTE